MNRRSLLERLGAASLAVAAAGTASARSTTVGDVTVQDDCVVECCSDCPLHCDGCLCGDPSC